MIRENPSVNPWKSVLMATATEEQQARDFLKRAEIRTMKKDLRALREGDALKERDKIAGIKTPEEQQRELQIKQEQAEVNPPSLIPAPVKPATGDKKPDSGKISGLKQVLQRSQTQERLAEKDLKNYATEQERQQIFLLESQRLAFESQMDAIDKEKIPVLKLEKNKFEIKKRELQEKIKPAIDQEEKLVSEQKVVSQKSRESVIPEQRKSLEQRRWDIEKEIQETEKKRWVLEKQIQETEEKIKGTSGFLEQLISEKNMLESKILGMDKSLREIYSGVIARVEEQRKGEAEDQKARREMLQKTKLEENERIQREQWTGINVPKKKEFLKTAPENFKQKLARSAAEEEQKRAQFLQDVESWSDTENQPSGGEKKTSNVPIPRK